MWLQACFDLEGDLLIMTSEDQRREVESVLRQVDGNKVPKYVWVGLIKTSFYWVDGKWRVTFESQSIFSFF